MINDRARTKLKWSAGWSTGEETVILKRMFCSRFFFKAACDQSLDMLGLGRSSLLLYHIDLWPL